MNPLPQRKKTAEEIAALRDSLAPIGQPPAIAQAAAPLPPPVQRIPAEPRPPVEARPVTSLRKSEQGIAPRKAVPSSATNSSLPTHRRGDQELNQIRRAQAFEVQKPGAFLIALTASLPLLAAGYFSVIAAALLPVIDWRWASVSYIIPAILAVAGLMVAAFIFLKKKRSLHHAGFIATIGILTLIFGALYYFPHLRNAP